MLHPFFTDGEGLEGEVKSAGGEKKDGLDDPLKKMSPFRKGGLRGILP